MRAGGEIGENFYVYYGTCEFMDVHEDVSSGYSVYPTVPGRLTFVDGDKEKITSE